MWLAEKLIGLKKESFNLKRYRLYIMPAKPEKNIN